MMAIIEIDITGVEMMPALTVRNIPDDIHRGLKALAAKHGRSAEAEVRNLIAAAVKPAGRELVGSALTSIWGSAGMTEAEAAIVNAARDREPAKPMSFDE